jgi:hypothetical protein
MLSTDALSSQKEDATRALGLTPFLNLISSKYPSVMKDQKESRIKGWASRAAARGAKL